MGRDISKVSASAIGGDIDERVDDYDIADAVGSSKRSTIPIC
jgi:hypothetical protein